MAQSRPTVPGSLIQVAVRLTTTTTRLKIEHRAKVNLYAAKVITAALIGKANAIQAELPQLNFFTLFTQRQPSLPLVGNTGDILALNDNIQVALAVGVGDMPMQLQWIIAKFQVGERVGQLQPRHQRKHIF